MTLICGATNVENWDISHGIVRIQNSVISAPQLHLDLEDRALCRVKGEEEGPGAAQEHGVQGPKETGTVFTVNQTGFVHSTT